MLVARSENSLHDVSKSIQAINSKVEVLPIPVDVTDTNSVLRLWAKVKEKFGHADVLVNNAGTANGSGPLVEADSKTWWGDFVSICISNLDLVQLQRISVYSSQETNVHGAFLITQGFLQLLGTSRPGHIITVTTGGALMIVPSLSSYAISKLASLQMTAFVAAENPNVTAIAMNPGIVMTNMTLESFKRFALDTPELPGGTGVWLTTEKAKFLNGRYISANWDVEELAQREEEILKENKLTMQLVGRLGMDQFE